MDDLVYILSSLYKKNVHCISWAMIHTHMYILHCILRMKWSNLHIKIHSYTVPLVQESYDRMLLYDQNLIKLNIVFFKFILCMYTSIKSLMGGPEMRHTCTPGMCLELKLSLSF